MCFNEDWRYQFTLVNNFCLLELIEVAFGHLDELQKAEQYPIRWSLHTGFTVPQDFGFVQSSYIDIRKQWAYCHLDHIVFISVEFILTRIYISQLCICSKCQNTELRLQYDMRKTKINPWNYNDFATMCLLKHVSWFKNKCDPTTSQTGCSSAGSNQLHTIFADLK